MKRSLSNFFSLDSDKTLNDFKNAKKFWQFYSPLIKTKADKNSNDSYLNIKYNDTTANDKSEICNIFNKFFTSIISYLDTSILSSVVLTLILKYVIIFEKTKIFKNNFYRL
jgi:hypothetical protein